MGFPVRLFALFFFALLFVSASELLAGPPTIVLTQVRDQDGSNSNSLGGAAETPLLRLSYADYPDGTGTLIWGEPDLPNPREISNAVASQYVSLPNRYGLSDMVWAWGQFLDHDIDLTHTSPANGDASVWVVSTDDPLWPMVPIDRSAYSQSSESPTRQQLNSITAFIDASNVYGSDPERASALRTFRKGRMKVSADGLVPLNLDGFPNAGGDDPTLFIAGDIRSNEQLGLTCMHTLFLREHNRLADRIAKHFHRASDEDIYQLARKIVGAEVQRITFNEFLPSLLGPYAPTLQEYNGFHSDVNPSIANEFSTALFRFGHSMLSPQLALVGRKDSLSSLPLRDAFFNPEFLQNDPKNVDRILAGLCIQQSQEIDCFVVDDVRNFLFGIPGQGGLDLATLNIQRGRDHGVPRYNDVRMAYGLPAVSSFSEITSDSFTQANLEYVYGDVELVDAWVGGLAEEHLPGASVGMLLTAAIRDQFERLRDGDRFFFLNDPDLKGKRLRSIIDLDRITLSDILQFNTDVKLRTDDVFSVRMHPRNHFSHSPRGR